MGGGINPGVKHDDYCDGFLAYPTSQGDLFLPMPADSNRYVLFHLRSDDFVAYETTLFYSLIDVREDSGLGGVLEKNVAVLRDTFSDAMTAVRHGNGRDWWIAVPCGIEPFGMYLLLLTPQGMRDTLFQELKPYFYNDINGQACFSPDGRKYCRNDGGRVYVYDFDRCNGVFSNRQSWKFPIDSVPFTNGGVAVSADSKFLYASTGGMLRQYELDAADIESTGLIVGAYDYPAATYYQLVLAPDNKIYGINVGTTNRLQVINTPDKKGGGCQFTPNTFVMPTKQRIFLPYFPTYRLYAASSSACDTLCRNNPANGNPYTASGIEFYPNPARDKMRFRLPLCPCGEWQVFNIAGQLVYTFPVFSPEGDAFELDVSTWPAGMYVLRGKTTNLQQVVERFVVVH